MAEPHLDLAYLSRQVFDDRDLERELLVLFRQQCERLGPILDGRDEDAVRADAAHTIRGAAFAIGARRIAEAAARFEGALGGEGAETARAELHDAIAATLAAVERRLAA